MEEIKNGNCPNCEVIAPGHKIMVDDMYEMKCSLCHKPLPFYSPSLEHRLSGINHEATRAREYLRLTGATCTPDRVHEILNLRTSRATLARKMREAAQRGELLRKPYTNERGTEIAAYCWNPDYKEGI